MPDNRGRDLRHATRLEIAREFPGLGWVSLGRTGVSVSGEVASSSALKKQ